MDKILEKISSYNILNNLLPGAIYCYLLELLCNVRLVNDSIVENVFVYYFVGMVISRIGSIVIEPICKKIKFVNYASYCLYVDAEKKDKKIEPLLETSNTYRTMAALCIVLLLSILVVFLYRNFDFFKAMWKYLMIGVLLVLFGASYKKQTKYIKERVESHFKEETRV